MSRFLICCGPQAQQRLARLQPYLPSHLPSHLPPHLPPPFGSTGQAPACATGAAGRENGSQAIGETGYAMLVDCGGRDSAPHSNSGVSQLAGVTLGFEGYCTHRSERGEALRRALIEDYLQHGERCVSQWRGSFRLAIGHQGQCRIYTDQLATRPILHASDDTGLFYSSHAAPLLHALPRRTLDGANLLQFMLAGRFFAGGTLFTELRQLPPGHCDRINLSALGAGGSEHKARTGMSWYAYRLQPQAASAQDVLPELKRRLDVAILAHWQSSNSPALLLSGGYDSRYLLDSLAALLPREQLAPMLTCLWGEANPDPNADAAWAAREAARHGLAFEFDLLQADPAQHFARAFSAQSGMTAHVFTHSDDMLRCQYLQQRGYHTLLRGDECFGPDGSAPANRQQAMARLGLFAAPTTLPWLTSPRAEWQLAHAAHLAQLSEAADDPCDLRDWLYCRERLPSLNAHLNALRAPFVENVNPLLDIEVLDLVRQLPRELRTDKQLFRQCFQRYFPTIGFAKSGHAFRWQRLASDMAMREFVTARLARLPAPFDAAKLPPLPPLQQATEQATAQATAQADGFDWAGVQTTIRALVLGQWLEDYPSGPAT